jgi:hypothetical protein
MTRGNIPSTSIARTVAILGLSVAFFIFKEVYK